VADPITLIVELQEKVTGPAEKAGFSLDALGEKAGGLAEMLGPVGVGVAATAGAFLAIGGVLAGVTVALGAFALEASEAKEKALATLSALGGGSEKAKQLYDALGAARDGLGMTRAELVPLTEQLLGMGVSTDLVGTKLKALATVKALGVEGGPEEYLAITKKLQAGLPIAARELGNLYKTGVNVNEIAKAMGISTKALEASLKKGGAASKTFGAELDKMVTDKGAEALAHQALSLTAQWDNFKESITDLFADVDVAPFLAGLKDLLGIFGAGTSSGKTFKAAITGAMNGVFVAASKALPYIKVGIERMIIVALKAYIIVKTHWTTIATVLKYVGIAFAVVVGAVVLVGAAFAAFIVTVVAVTGAMIGLAGLIVAFVVKAVVALASWATSATQAATDFVMGLVNGVKNGAGLVIDAVKGLGKSVLGGLKNVLGIASPSKEFAKLGMHAGAGFAAGLDASTAGVSFSAEGMGAAATQSAAPVASRSSSGGGGGAQVTFAPGSVVINGAGKDVEQITELMLATVFEKIALTQGLGTGA
jgi:hypothetical protein